MNSLKWINTIAFLAMVGVNIAANVIPIGGVTTGGVSKAYPNLFTPAPITFAIWGVIYCFLILFVLFQIGIVGSKSTSSMVRDEIGIAFAFSCALNIAWIFAWHMKKIELSTILIALLLLSLICITKRVDKVNSSFLSYIMVNVGFDIYFGWIIAATIANVSVMLTKMNWSGWGISDATWTVIIIIVGALIGAAVVIVENRYISGLAIIWAYIGIMIKHLSQIGYAGKYMIIVFAAAIGIVIISGAAIYRLIVPNPRAGVVSSLG
ncbi:MAG: tryptophan-rich sensory protein [Saccharofermentans sp.]|nr:tryptophan-rich sensory protein [Saccharofermentans sp.]